MRKYFFFFVMLVCSNGIIKATNPTAPTGLMTELLSHPEKTLINDYYPEFSWIVNDSDKDELQTAYQILASSSLDSLENNIGDLWDSEKVNDDQSVSVSYGGDPLTEGTYYWKVRTWDKDGNVSPYSEYQKFNFSKETFSFLNANSSDGHLNLGKSAYAESLDGENWENVVFESRLKISEVAVGLLFRLQDDNNFYMWQFSNKNQALRPHKKVGGNFSVIKEVSYPFKVNTSYDVKIVLDGSNIMTYINNELVDSTSDATFSKGKIGFRQGRTETGEIDFVTVSKGDTVLFSEDFNRTISTVNYYSVETSIIEPKEFVNKGFGSYFVDFGKAAFGRLKFTLTSSENKTITLKFGESREGNYVDASPPNGNVVYYSKTMNVQAGTNTYEVAMAEPNSRQQAGMPDVLFNTMPFRYCELINVPGTLTAKDVMQEAVFYPFDDSAAVFSSSDDILNQVWDLCHYSMKATSWLGMYVDGNRERLPYEADAYIQQLGHMCADRDAYSIARRSHEYLIINPTWPTEWTPHSVLMAYADWMWTGDTESLTTYFEDLKAKTQHTLTESNNLISTKTGLVTSDYINSIHYTGSTKYEDIVDWPAAERDGYVFKDYNTVVNAVHHGAIERFAQVSSYLGKTDEATYFNTLTNDHKNAFISNLWSDNQKKYIDGIGTDHASLHASAFAVAFGLANDEIKADIADFLSGKGMDCSVYGSQYFLEALYEVNEGQKALDLMRSKSTRSWYNMIAEGSTISMEAWGQAYKSNQDWNHAWGAAPANIIPRCLMGIRPLEPGFRKIQIKPQTGDLKNASIKVPTVRGDVLVSIENTSSSYTINLETPANTVSKVYIPILDVANDTVKIDGVEQVGVREGEFIVFDNIGSGEHTFIRNYSLSLNINSAKLNNEEALKIYPNPVTNTLTIDVKDHGIANVDITNNIGTIVFSKSIKSGISSIDLSDLESGIYIVQASYDNQIQTRKLIKK